MSVQVRRRRESASFLATYVGAQGELLVDTTKNQLQVHDGVTPGGWPAAKAGANTDITSFAGVVTATIGATAPAGTCVLTVINGNALQPPDNRTVAQFGSANGTSGRVLFDGYGDHVVLSFRRASGTAASPAAINANDSFGAISAWGYGATRYNTGPSSGMIALDLRAAETWTDTAQGTFMTLETAAKGTALRVERVRVDHNGFVGIGATVPDGLLTLNGNAVTTANALPTASTILHGISADASSFRAILDSYASASVFIGRRAQGTGAAPSAVQTDQTLALFAGGGYGTTSFSIQLGGMYVTAAENFTDTAQGTYTRFYSVLTGTVVQAERMRIQPSGGLSLGTSTFNATDPGAGNLAVQGSVSVGGSTVAAVAQLTNRNTVINGNFAVNQRAYASGTALAAGAYAHDRWKAGAAGCTYTFAQAVPDTTITITAGTLVQAVDAPNVYTTAYWLSWTGTAQGRVWQGTAAGSYAASPILVSGLTTGAIANVEFGAGTLGLVQLEAALPNAGPTQFERRHLGHEVSLCQRYFQKSYAQAQAPGTAATTPVVRTPDATVNYMSFGYITFKGVMRATPTIVIYNPTTGSSSTAVNGRNIDAATNLPVVVAYLNDCGFSCLVNNTSTLAGYSIGIHYTSSAEI